MSIVNEKTGAWIAAHRLDLRTEAGIQIAGMITAELDQRDRAVAKRDARIADLEAQNEWLKTRIAELQLPSTKRDYDTREKWLLQCGMPSAKACAA